MKQTSRLGEECLKRLNELGLERALGAVDEQGDPLPTGDILLQRGQKIWRFNCLIDIGQLRPGTSRNRVTEIKNKIFDRLETDEQEESCLLFTERVTETVGQILRDLGVNYIDTAGNAWIQNADLHVWVEGKQAASVPLPRRTTTKALQLSFLFLTGQHWCNETYRRLAEHTGLSIGMISKTVKMFMRDGHVNLVEKDRQLRQPEKFLAHWEDHWRTQLRPHLGEIRCQGRPDPEFRELLKTCSSEPEWIIGGELAATQVVGNVVPVNATIHVPPGSRRKAMERMRLRPNPDGPITILETFGSNNTWQAKPSRIRSDPTLQLADPILIRAELLGNQDDRLRTLATELLERFITPRWEA